MDEPNNGRFGEHDRRLAALEDGMGDLNRSFGHLEGRFSEFSEEQSRRHTENRDAIKEATRETSANRRWVIGAVIVPSFILLLEIVGKVTRVW